MSSASSWSYVHDATHWPLLARDAGGREQFGPPAPFKCDYILKAQAARAPSGEEYVAKARIFTERATIAIGDRVLIGRSSAPDPIAAGADEVKGVTRYPDTFDRLRDDFEIMTG